MTNNFYEVNNSFFEDFMRCISTEKEQDVENANLCLISNEPIEKYAIRLNCGHTFNYEPLLISIYKYKEDKKLCGVASSFVTECPYCREKTDGILPYLPGHKKIKDVNIPHKESFGSNTCKYIMGDKNACGKKCYFEKCYLHINKHDIIQCNGITKSGTQCKNKATPLENCCKLHQK